MQLVAVDILGPLPELRQGNAYLLVVADYFTHWMEAYMISNHEVATVAKVLTNEYFLHFSTPEQLHSDHGHQLVRSGDPRGGLRTTYTYHSTTSSVTSTGLYIPFAKDRPHSYRGYSSTAIEKAHDAVESGDMSIHRAAEGYGIPRTTLHNKVSGKVDKVVNSGPKTYLTDE